MTTDELQRLRKMAESQIDLIEVEWKGMTDYPLISELLTVLRAFLTLHPADDSEPLTVETLTRLGGQVTSDARWHFKNKTDDPWGVAIDYHDNTDAGDVYRLSDCGTLPRLKVSTVGELRRLCAVFGIPITSPASAASGSTG